MLKTIFFLFLSLSSQAFASTPPPPADAVFKLAVRVQDPNTFILDWQLKPGYFLYKDRIHLIEPETEKSIITLTPVQLPKAKIKTDKQGKKLRVYRNHLLLPITVLGRTPGEMQLQVHAQGCSDGGFCYPPKISTIQLTIDKHLALTQTVIITPTQEPVLDKKITEIPGQNWDDTFSHHHWMITLAIFLGFGLLLSFTPCVLPMIPVLSGIIVGQGKNLSTRQAFLLSLSYVLSMSLTYAGVGAVVALMGQNLQLMMQSPGAIILFSLIFVLLSLAMFNVYELRLPLSWQAALARLSYHQARGHYVGAAIMGCLSTLILSPCVTAPLIGALGYIARSGNVLLGVSSLFALGFGMGIPLLLIGTSLGKWLPHAGAWMNTVKSLFGIILLGVAIDLMSRILPPVIIMGLWAILFIFSALFLGAFRRAKSNPARLIQGIALILLIYGILILIGTSLGHTNPWQPLVSSQSSDEKTSSVSFLTVKTQAEVQQAMDVARREGRPVMIDFYADWCRSCKAIESMLERDPRIQEAFKPFLLLKADITANDPASIALMKQWEVIAPPTFLFFNAKGDELADLRLIGESSVDEFLSMLNLSSRL